MKERKSNWRKNESLQGAKMSSNQTSQSIKNLLSNKPLIIGGIIFLIVLVLIVLLSINVTRTPTFVSIFILVIVLIVGSIGFIFLWPQTPQQGTLFTVTLNNPDPTLSQVEITMPDGSDYILIPGQSQAGITLNATQTIKSTGYRVDSSGKSYSYDLDYIFNNIAATEIFYTCGGVQTNNSFISSLPVFNKSPSPITLYTQDIKGNIYGYDVVSVGASTITSYVGQYLSTSSDGTGAITIPSTSTVNVIIDSKGNISVSNLPTAKIKFENGTKKDGWLQYQNPWEVSSSWVTTSAISKHAQSQSILVTLGQWWRIISKKNSQPITNVYIISESDLQNSNTPIVLSD